MATSTLKDVFSTTVTDCFVNQVSSHLSEWLKTNKSVDVSAQDICEAFNVPFTPRPSMTGLPQAANMPTQMPNIPGYFQGSGASASPAGRRGGRKKAPRDPNAPTCVYQFQRGNKKGQVCGEQVAQDGRPGAEEYCKNCLKKKTVQNRINSGSSSKSSVQPPVLPGGMVSVPEQSSSSAENTIDAVPIDGHNDLFMDLKNNFILKQYEDGSLVALAVEEKGHQRDLTAEEKVTAQALGLCILDTPSPAPAVQSVPTIPTVAATDTVAAIPSIPTIPQVGV